MNVHALIDIEEEGNTLADSKLMEADSLELTGSVQVSLVLSGLECSIGIENTLCLLFLSSVWRLNDGFLIDLLDQSDQVGRDFQCPSDLVLPAPEHVVRNVFSIHVHAIEIDCLKVDAPVHILNDLLLKHLLANLLGLLLIAFNMLKYPSIYVAAVHHAHALTKPTDFVVLGLDVAADELRPFSQLL